MNHRQGQSQETIGLQDKPFPLKKYFLLYGSIGAVIFYVLLFTFFLSVQRDTLYQQYVRNVSEKANLFYLDIKRDILTPNHVTLATIGTSPKELQRQLREKIDEKIHEDFKVAKVKIFTVTGLTLYDSHTPENEGAFYATPNEKGFGAAVSGKTFCDIDKESTGERFIEIYMPVFDPQTNRVQGIFEMYDDASPFEKFAQQAMRKALFWPTIIFVLFSIMLYAIVSKADQFIERNTNLLVATRTHLEKYLSPTAVNAITDAVSKNRDLFTGKHEELVVFFSDIRGFTQYAEQNEPQKVVHELNRFFELQANLIEAYGGTIDKFVGDEIMAIFPAKQISKAVQCSFEIMKAIDANKQMIFELGIGLHYGEAIVGSLGTQSRRDYTAIGDTINTGARLCAAAEPCEVLVSQVLWQALSEDLQLLFTHDVELTLKGKRKAVRVRGCVLDTLKNQQT